MPAESHDKRSSVEAWEQQRNQLKTMWIASVALFWISSAIQVVIFVLRGEINLILVSVIVGMMMLGVGLKFRYQRYLRTKPGT